MKENFIIALIALVFMIIFFYLRNLIKLGNILKKKQKKNKNYEIIEVKYLCLTSNLNRNYLLNREMMLVFSIVNSLIIDLVFLVVMIIKVPIFVKFIIGFVLFFGLIYSIYGILGKILVMKGYDKK